VTVVPSNDHSRNSRLVRYLTASGISLYGDWLTTFALVVLLFRDTGSATGPALYMLARVAPRTIGPTPGGILSDRFGPVPVAVIGLALQAVITAAIVPAGAAGAIWVVLALVAFGQFVNATSQPAYAAMPPRLASHERLGRVNGLYGGLVASSILVSPAIGALVLPHTSPEVLITADAATFVVAALLVATLRVGGMPPRLEKRRLSARLGWTVIARDATLRSGTAAICGNSAVVTTLQALLVVAATQHFHHDTYVGWLYAAVGAGGLAASLLFLRPTPRHIRRRDIVLLAAGEVIAFAGFVFALNIVLAALLLFLSSVAAVSYQVLSAIAIQQRVPLHLLGRANGARRQAMYVGMLLGAIAALALARPLGWQATVLLTCVGAVAGVIVATATGPRDHVDVDEADALRPASTSDALLHSLESETDISATGAPARNVATPQVPEPARATPGDRRPA
jgi:MFS family permease